MLEAIGVREEAKNKAANLNSPYLATGLRQEAKTKASNLYPLPFNPYLVGRAGFEPATLCLKGRYSAT